MSNPYRREWPAWWTGAKERDFAVRHWLSLGASALRIRHGARAACRRLREERDEAVIAARELAKDLDAAREWIDVASRTLAKVVEEGPKIDAQTRELAAEADAARLELRALEWLIVHHHDELRGLVLAAGDRANRYSYCARALGWEG